MSAIGRKSGKRHGSSTEKSSSGKENEPPSSRTSVRKPLERRAEAKSSALRERARLANSARTNDRGLVLEKTTDSFPLPRRTSFDVHRDKSEETLRGRGPSAARAPKEVSRTAEGSGEEEEDPRGRIFRVARRTKIPVRVDSAARGFATGVSSTLTRTTAAPSKARSVSTSRPIPEAASRRDRRFDRDVARTDARSSSVEPGRSTRRTVGASTSSSTTAAGRWSSSTRFVESKTEVAATQKRSERSVGASKDRPVVPSTRSTETNGTASLRKIGRSETRRFDRVGGNVPKNEIGSAARIDGRNGARTQPRNEARAESAITPIDGPAAPPLALLPVKAKYCVPKRAEGREARGDETAAPFPAELIYHAEYHDYLPVVEKERDERSPRLSSSFLREHINAEQRRLIVVFLLHSATHCRYPSYVVYQAVKLFDAAVDRVPVETSYMQLTGLAALWIALKGQENFHRIPSATTMVALAKDMYLGREDLLMKYERKILLALNFNVRFADAFSLFTHHLINCGRQLPIADETMSFVYNCGGCLIDLSLLDEKFCRLSPRLVAATAAELALVLAFDLDEPTETETSVRPRWHLWRRLVNGDLPNACRFPDERIDGLRVALIRRVLGSGKRHTDFDVLYKKYSRSRHGRIAERFLERVKRIPLAEIFDPV